MKPSIEIKSEDVTKDELQELRKQILRINRRRGKRGEERIIFSFETNGKKHVTRPRNKTRVQME